MALNTQVFKTRSLTAIVFTIAMLAGILINFYTFIGLFLLILCGCLYEFRKLIKLIKPTKYVSLLALSIPYIIMPILMMIELGRKYNEGNVGYLNYSFIYPLAILISIWINDTMAYLVGSFIGKTPLTKISPKKTWEGTIGGAVLCIILVPTILHFIPAFSVLGWQHWLHIALICSVFGSIGDLIESKIKRLANVKDSGNFMPGHGGFLDRFDSLLVATPFVWLYVQIFVL